MIDMKLKTRIPLAIAGAIALAIFAVDTIFKGRVNVPDACVVSNFFAGSFYELFLCT